MPEFAAYEPDRPSAERAVPTIAPLGLAAVAECAALAAAREGDDLERWVEVFRRRAAADPVGPTCHLGTPSCFDGHPLPPLGFLAELEQILASRKGADPATSYTASLYGKGTKRIAQKVGEEGVEVALAAMAKDREELINESADLLYHLTVLLQNEGLGLKDVVQRLHERHNK